MTPEQLAEIRARAEAATPGPWECGDDGWPLRWPEGAEGAVPWWATDMRPPETDPYWPYDISFPTMDFVAHARTDIPALLDYIEELQAVLWRAAGVYGEPLTDIEALRKSHRIISDFLTSKEPTSA